MNRNIDNEHQVVELLKTLFPQIQAIYLFGSFATNEQRQDSDIDLAILMPKSISFRQLISASSKLMGLVKRDVDLIDLRSVSTVFSMQIIQAGARLLVCDPLAVELYETHILSDYVRLNEQRAEIINQVKERGTIYG